MKGSELTHHTIENYTAALIHYHGFGYRAQHQNLWCDCVESHTNSYGGHACRWEWYWQFIEVLCAQLHHNLSWGFQYSVVCV